MAKAKDATKTSTKSAAKRPTKKVATKTTAAQKVGFKETNLIRRVTAKAPNKIMEQVMPLERSPFCFMCRIISTPPERNWIIQNVLKRSRDYLG